MSRTLRRAAAVLTLVSVAALAIALPASARGKPYHVTLSGAAERPDLGDPDATGTADITVNPGTREVCWDVSVENVNLPLVAAHIHSGDATVAGPPVIFLIPMGQTDADGEFSGCATVDRSLLIQLVASPDQFYVNVHNDPFFAGAARGQLG